MGSGLRACVVIALLLPALLAAQPGGSKAPAVPQVPQGPIAVGRPDLVLEGPVDGDCPHCISSPGPCKCFQFTVRNAGTADAKVATTLRLRCTTEVGTPAEPRCARIAGGWGEFIVSPDATQEEAIPPLHKAESFKVGFAGYRGGTGNWRLDFTATVDPNNTVTESNEWGNNSKSFKRAGTDPPPLARQDLKFPTPIPTATPTAPLKAKPATPGPGMQQIMAQQVTLSVQPLPYVPGKETVVIATNKSAVAMNAGSVSLKCSKKNAPYTCTVVPDGMPLPALAPGQWQNLGAFHTSQPQGNEQQTLTIKLVGVPGKELVLP